MKRKTSDVPTRIYSYRCLPPLTEAARVEDQFRLAHQYKNALVKIELDLRERFRDVQLTVPQVAAALLAYEDADAAVESAIEDLRAAKSGTANPDLAAHRLRLEAAKELRALRGSELRDAKRDHDEVLRPGYEDARKGAHAEMLAARADFSRRGLRHGTYVRIEDAVQQAARSTKRPLHFERYDGSGSIGTQLVGRDGPEGVRGLTLSELHSCVDTRLRVAALPCAGDVVAMPPWGGFGSEDVFWNMRRGDRRRAARVHMWLRVGSNPDRSPIFAEFPITMHRPLPKDAIIKWAYVVRKRIGPHLEWRFQVTIESKTFCAPTAAFGEGTCAIDLGWRWKLDDEGQSVALRAGYLVDDQGRERELVVPEKLWRQMPKVYDLAKIRDQNLERAQLALSEWIADRGEIPPEWQAAEEDGRPSMADRLRGYAQWRAARKLQAFVDRWTERRVPGDAAIYDQIQAWARQDRHLQAWSEHQRDRLIAHRREVWRVIAAEIARTYSTILIEDGRNANQTMRLPEIEGWERPAPEDGDPSDGRDQRRTNRLVAPGELRDAIVKAAHKTGAKIEVERSAGTTKECARCGHTQEHVDFRAQITYRCEGCGAIDDQDANACRNLLKRHGIAGGPVPPRAPKVLAPAKRPPELGNHGASHAAETFAAP